MIKEVKIINLGYGNVNAIARMLNKRDVRVEIIDKPLNLNISEKTLLVLPGVGAWDHAVKKLDILGWKKFIRNNLDKNFVFLGICLGMQLFFEKSEEGSLSGLNLIKGSVIKVNPNGKVNIGWREVKFKEEFTKYKQRYYHVHKFKVNPQNDNIILGYETYSKSPVLIKQNNIIGCQFHPEKSHYFGSKFFKKILSIRYD